MRIRRALAIAALGACSILPAQAASAAVIADDCPVGTSIPGQITNAVGDVGCVTTQHNADGSILLLNVLVADGWNYRIKSGSFTAAASKVEVEFRSSTTVAKCVYSIRPGQVKIAGACTL